MNMIDMLHTLILGPIELLFDVIFSIVTQLTTNAGLSIVVLSVAVNFLVLPLYNKADAIQREEQEISAKLKPRIDRIKKAFSGDERFMILQTYYRQNHYQPWYVLRGSISLLLQIPFFMAAYNFLSGLQTIQGVPFGPIRNLGEPDGLIQIGGITFHLLPILMTLINVISGAIYTRDQPLKSKIQLYGMAIVFLFLLYQSPAGLVLYWTLNNVFSLGKNIINKLKNPKRAVAIGSSLVGAITAIFFLTHLNSFETKRLIWGFAASVIFQLPLLFFFFQSKRKKNCKPVNNSESRRNCAIFWICCVLLTILTGILIPSAVIRSSPSEFIDAGRFLSPTTYIWNAFFLAAGTFVIWFSIYFLLADKQRQRVYSFAVTVIATVALANYMFFGKGYGDMSSLLQYGLELPITTKQKLINLSIIVLLAIVLLFIWKYKKAFVRILCTAECLAIAGMSVANIAAIQSELPEIEKAMMSASQNEQKDIIHLDKKGKNVVVLMLDRAIGALVPFMFEEQPELKEQFRGFTWYPNTMSYGPSTNTGSPGLYGGYDYVPEEMEKRSDVLLKDKQNEALKIMPYNFLNAGYEVTVCDPPYANYQWIPDLSIYDDYPEIRRFNTEGMFQADDPAALERYQQVRNRNFFCYSIFRISPVIIQGEIYDNGNYNETDLNSEVLQRVQTFSIAQGLDGTFLESYRVLEKMKDITDISDNGKNCFLMFANQTTHHPVMLQEPEYEPSARIDNTAYDREHAVRVDGNGRRLGLSDLNQIEHYQANMAALKKIGQWLDNLRENKVYDNTRIIIVSDHGWDFGTPGYEETASAFKNVGFNPVLMVKDFDSQEDFQSDDAFMTNADTPLLAFQGVIESPQNPFLNCSITDTDKWKTEQQLWIADWHVNAEATQFNGSYFTVNPAEWRCQ